MRYFFHVDAGAREPDATGTEFAAECDALRAAVRFAGELLRDEPELIEHGGALRVEVEPEPAGHGSIFTLEVRTRRAAAE